MLSFVVHKVFTGCVEILVSIFIDKRLICHLASCPLYLLFPLHQYLPNIVYM